MVASYISELQSILCTFWQLHTPQYCAEVSYFPAPLCSVGT